MSLRLSELAARLGASLENLREDLLLTGVAMPDDAGPQELTFISTTHSPRTLAAGAALVSQRFAVDNALMVDDVMLACARACAWLPARRRTAARRARPTSLAASARIAATAHVGAGVEVGEASVVEAGVVLDDGVTIGAHCHIEAGAVIRGEASIGNRVRIGAGTCIGSVGFAYLRDGTSWQAMPSFGSVRIDDDVDVLARAVVHAGVLGDTLIASGCILDSQVLIGHDSMIGAHSAIAGQTAVAGASRIGRDCRIGGMVGIGEGVQIADGVTVTAMSMVSRSIHTAGARYSSGWPAEASATWWRRVANFRRTRG